MSWCFITNHILGDRKNSKPWPVLKRYPLLVHGPDDGMHKLNQKHRPNCHEAKTEKEGPTQGLTWHNETSEIQMNVVLCVVHIHRLGLLLWTSLRVCVCLFDNISLYILSSYDGLPSSVPEQKPHQSKGAFRQVAIMLTNFWSSLVCFAHCAGRQHDGKPWEMEIRKVMKDHVCVALVSISHLSRYHICSLSLSLPLFVFQPLWEMDTYYIERITYIYTNMDVSVHKYKYIYIHVYVNYIYHTQK